jgi:signal transduction histidine kinase
VAKTESGIGLAICARIVAHYGRRIWAKGEEGKGDFAFRTIPSQLPQPKLWMSKQNLAVVNKGV